MSSRIDQGSDAYAAARGRAEPKPDTELVKTPFGRGQLMRRAEAGDREARAVLRRHRLEAPDGRAEYDDPTAGDGEDA